MFELRLHCNDYSLIYNKYDGHISIKNYYNQENQLFDNLLNSYDRLEFNNDNSIKFITFDLKNTFIQEQNKNTIFESDSWKNHLLFNPSLSGVKFIKSGSYSLPKNDNFTLAKINLNFLKYREVNVLEYYPFYSNLPIIYLAFQITQLIIKLLFFAIEFRWAYFIFFNTLFSYQYKGKHSTDENQKAINEETRSVISLTEVLTPTTSLKNLTDEVK